MAVNILLQEDEGQPGLSRPTAVSERTVATVMVLLDVVLMAAVAGLAVLVDNPGGFLPLLTLTQLLFFVFWKFMFGLYPGHGLARAQRMRQAALAVAVGLVTTAGVFEIMTRVLVGASFQLPFWPIILGAVLVGLSDPLVRRLLMRLGRW